MLTKIVLDNLDYQFSLAENGKEVMLLTQMKQSI